MDTVGSSMDRGFRGRSAMASAAKVSPMSISVGPVSHTMSPAPTSSTSTRSSPRVTHSCTTRAFSCPVVVQSVPVWSVVFHFVETRTKGSPLRICPCRILPQPMRPTYSFHASVLTCMRKGLSGSTSGAGT